MENEKRVLWSELGSLYVQIHGKYKDKTKQKPPEVEEAREGKSHNRVKRAPPRPWAHHGQSVAATTGRGGHWLWWLGSFAPLRFSVLRCFALGRGFLPF